MKTNTVESEFKFLHPVSQTYLNYDIFDTKHLLTTHRVHFKMLHRWWLPPCKGRKVVRHGVGAAHPALSTLTVPCGREHIGTYAVSTIVKQECEQILKNIGASWGIKEREKHSNSLADIVFVVMTMTHSYTLTCLLLRPEPAKMLGSRCVDAGPLAGE